LGTVWIKNTRDEKNWGEKSCTRKENTKTIEKNCRGIDILQRDFSEYHKMKKS
jgi:hypothetical protein